MQKLRGKELSCMQKANSTSKLRLCMGQEEPATQLEELAISVEELAILHAVR